MRKFFKNRFVLLQNEPNQKLQAVIYSRKGFGKEHSINGCRCKSLEFFEDWCKFNKCYLGLVQGLGHPFSRNSVPKTLELQARVLIFMCQSVCEYLTHELSQLVPVFSRSLTAQSPEGLQKSKSNYKVETI